MEQICSSTNLNQALRRVKKNKGCAGVDKLDIDATIFKLRQASNGQRFARVFWMEATDLTRSWCGNPQTEWWRQTTIPVIIEDA
ncbi:hypothetical protein VIBHAR_01303 [Vibrio campbellii ATCC BAA-1116]|uniref:Uncharacterized protein n=1 Tax=Vibrio campbellii (strain ATCC BAA-1116) TaxID=2902295 RepID=A7MT76_VIBC1|nr:hypothetical protein VIBHAR_01303 [Vibrio campbellii ATCC BAA-1116]